MKDKRETKGLTIQEVLATGEERGSWRDLHAEVTWKLARLVAISEPGTKLPTERHLSEMMGVGRSTVREALRSLAFVGAITIRHGDGTYVSDVEATGGAKLVGLGLLANRAKLQEIIEVRQLLEIEAVSKAAERHTVADRKRLRGIMEQLREADTDLVEASRLDVEFHVALAQASHNAALTYLITGMRGLLEIWISRSINHQEVIRRIVGEHDAILSAVLARDDQAASLIMTGHLVNASKGLLTAIGTERVMLEYISSIMMSNTK